MKLKTRAVEIAGITCQPDEVWMTQVARNLTDADDGFLRDVQYLILDRDPLYTAAFRRPAAGQWREPLLLPARLGGLLEFYYARPPWPRTAFSRTTGFGLNDRKSNSFKDACRTNSKIATGRIN